MINLAELLPELVKLCLALLVSSSQLAQLSGRSQPFAD